MANIRYRNMLLKFSIIIVLFLWIDFFFKVHHLFLRLRRIDEIDADSECRDQRSHNRSVAVDTRTCPRLDCGRVEVRRSMPQNRQLVLQGDASIVNEVPAFARYYYEVMLAWFALQSISYAFHMRRDVFALLWCDAFIIALPDCDPWIQILKLH